MKLILIILILFSFACNSTKKAVSKAEIKTDSTATVLKDSSVVSMVDSISFKETVEEYDTETTIQYDTAYTYDVVDMDVTNEILPMNKGKIYQRVKSVTIKSKGKIETKEAVKLIKKDSAGKKEESKVEVQTESKTVDKKIEKKKFPFGLVIGFVMIVALGLIWFFLDRRVPKRKS